jgi:hypothetical protein
MRVRLLVALAVAGVAAFVAAGSAGAAADSTCPGGILASGIYNNVTVTGTCTASGEVWIKGNLTVNGNSVFDATFGTINGNVQAWSGSVLSLDSFSITHSVSASGARSVVLISDRFGQGVLIQGGGGATVGACSRHDVPVTQQPIAEVFANDVVGTVSIAGRGGCVNEIANNSISGGVNFVNNRADVNGGFNGIFFNVISGNLFCKNNSPHPSGNGTNSVGGTINFPGDCATP